MLRESQSHCPGCGESIATADFALCRWCHGAWVSEPELERRIRAVRNDRDLRIEVIFEAAPLGIGGRLCPRCHGGLAPHTVGAVEIDRCSKHGVWFDADELARVLAASHEGVGVLIHDTPLDPAERAELERICAEHDASRGGLDAGDGIELLGVIASVFAWLFD